MNNNTARAISGDEVSLEFWTLGNHG